MPLYLSRLFLNRECRAVRADLADCHALHCRVMAAFPKDIGGRQDLGVLYRFDAPPLTKCLTLLVQARQPPTWTHLLPTYLAPSPDSVNPDEKPLDQLFGKIRNGDLLRFRLRANPTRRIDKRRIGQEQDRLSGKRVALLQEDDQLAWLARKGDAGGFELTNARIRYNDLRPVTDEGGMRVRAVERIVDTIVGVRPVQVVGEERSTQHRVKSHSLTFGAVVFEGVLRVTDADLFRRTLEQGIGSGKAYGFGLLSIAPARG